MKKAIFAAVAVALFASAPALALSPEQESQLKGLLDKKSVEVLGKRPADSIGYTNDGKTPRKGCQLASSRRDPATGRTFGRFTCTR
jgi:hypothetical protein